LQDEKDHISFNKSDKSALGELLRLANNGQSGETDMYSAFLKLFNAYIDSEETDREFNKMVKKLHPDEKPDKAENPELGEKIEKPVFYTNQEVADMLRISLRKLFSLRRDKKIKAVKVGHHIRFKKEEVERYLEEN